MRTTLGYHHKIMYHIFKNLEFISTARGYEPLYLPCWSSEPADSTTASLLSPSGKLVHFYKDPTPLVSKIAQDMHQANPQKRQKYFYQYFYPMADKSHPDGLRHQATAGIEYFNESRAIADLEIIELCLQLIERLALGKVHLELGHAGFTEAFAEHLGLNAIGKAALRVILEKKDQSAAVDFAQTFNLGPGDLEAIIQLQSCFGSAKNVLEITRGLSSSKAMEEAIKELQSLVEGLSLGEDQLHLDLGFSNHQGYYTGPVFRIYSPLSHQALFTGGRYDKFHATAGPLAACGANLLIPNILEVIMMTLMQQQNRNLNQQGTDIALVDSPDANPELLNLKQGLQTIGLGFAALETDQPQSLQDIQGLLAASPSIRWLIYSEGDSSLQVIDTAYNQSYKTTADGLIRLLLASRFDLAIH